MSTMQTDIISQLRPRTVGELIDGAFRIYRRNFRTFLMIAAVVYLPVGLLSYGADIFLLGTYSSADFSTSPSASLVASSVSTEITTLKTYLETFLEYFAQWALTIAVASSLLDRPLSFGEAYGEVERRFRDVLGLIGLQVFIVLGFFFPLIMSFIALYSTNSSSPGSIALLSSCFSLLPLLYAIIQIRLQVIVPAAVNEDLSPREALSRSWELTRNYWWRTLALSIVLGILSIIVSLGPSTVLISLATIFFKLDYNTNLAVTRGIGILTTLIYVPVQVGAIALYYFDQRVRKEGFDLDTAIYQRYGNMESVPSQGMWQDRDYYPPLAPSQPPQAMNTFTRTTAPTNRNMRWVSVQKTKRKTDRPNSFPGGEAEQ